MKQQTAIAIAIATGGTGGHVFPALALAEELKKTKIQSFFVTDKRGANYGIPSSHSLTHVMPHAVRWGRLLLMLVMMPFWLWRTIMFFNKRKVRLVVSFGSYAAIPSLLAARLLSLPLILHEQNAFLGRVNRNFHGLASSLALSFANTEPRDIIRQWHKKKRVVVTGVPIRSLSPPEKQSAPPYTIGVLGGSQGAHALSTIVPLAIANLNDSSLVVLHQARTEDVVPLRAQYKAQKIKSDVRPFFKDMASFYSNCDVLIARAGASTLAEASAMGVPLILIPYPHATDRHQHVNAIEMKKYGVAIVIEEGAKAPLQLQKALKNIIDSPPLSQKMRTAALSLPHKEAAGALAAEVQKFIKGERA